MNAGFELQGSGPGILASGNVVYSYYPHHLVAGDVDNDGRLDVLSATEYYGSTLELRLGGGDGTLGETLYLHSANSVSALVMQDVNADGNLDIIYADPYVEYAGFSLNVLLGQGDGSFADAVGYAAGFYNSALALGDVDGDGLPDIVTAALDMDTYANQLYVLRNLGDGSFGSAEIYQSPNNIHALALADLDGSLGLDIVAVMPDEYILCLKLSLYS